MMHIYIRILLADNYFYLQNLIQFILNYCSIFLTFVLFSWVEVLFNLRIPVEKLIADVMRFVQPYLEFVSYRFHVEKARDAGMFIT